MTLVTPTVRRDIAARYERAFGTPFVPEIAFRVIDRGIIEVESAWTYLTVEDFSTEYYVPGTNLYRPTEGIALRVLFPNDSYNLVSRRLGLADMAECVPTFGIADSIGQVRAQFGRFLDKIDTPCCIHVRQYGPPGWCNRNGWRWRRMGKYYGHRSKPECEFYDNENPKKYPYGVVHFTIYKVTVDDDSSDT